MIHISDEDIVLERRTGDGRFVLFTRTDLPAGSVLPWSGAMLDTGGDGYGIGVNPDAGPLDDAWSVADLLNVCLSRAMLEEQRRPGLYVDELVHHLRQAQRVEQQRGGGCTQAGHLCFLPGLLPSPYPWTDVARGAHLLPLCPDPLSRDEGVAPEQLLLVLDQLFADWLPPIRLRRHSSALRRHISQALTAERQRVAWLRRGSP